MNKHGVNSTAVEESFRYGHLGTMLTIGGSHGIYDGKGALNGNIVPSVTGFWAFVMWRLAYWTKQVSIANKLLIPMHWFKSAVFGRDLSRF
jgi:NADH dehydrogenase FAD-containing subunit